MIEFSPEGMNLGIGVFIGIMSQGAFGDKSIFICGAFVGCAAIAVSLFWGLIR